MTLKVMMSLALYSTGFWPYRRSRSTGYRIPVMAPAIINDC